eukprot:GHVL01043319.1.p1 GENE.GHVL01043319.1~~GHVL01043319.1.p1  ORF type:complete len:204 (+),score=27.59 GHVL01043319.1:55-666(+)
MSTFDYIISAGASGLITKTAVAPLERIRLIYQTQGMTESGRGAIPLYGRIPETVKRIINEEGVCALWKGNVSNVLRAMMVYGLKFGVNDMIKAEIVKNRELSLKDLLFSSTIAGLVQKLGSFPFDLVTVRIALGVNNKRLGGTGYNSIIGCFSRVIKTEGIGGLYKGLAPTIITGVPYVTIQLSTFHNLKNTWPDRFSVSTIY